MRPASPHQPVDASFNRQLLSTVFCALGQHEANPTMADRGRGCRGLPFHVILQYPWTRGLEPKHRIVADHQTYTSGPHRAILENAC